MPSSAILSSIGGILRNSWRPLVEARRFRYWQEMRQKNYIRRFGWNDNLPRGLLPRSPDFDKLGTLPIYRPRSGPYSRKKVLLGQNDYIDILGNKNLHPARIVKGVPAWLKTFRGNEFQRLIRKSKMFDRGIYPSYRPTRWAKMKTRMDWLWYQLNYRKKILN